MLDSYDLLEHFWKQNLKSKVCEKSTETFLEAFEKRFQLKQEDLSE